jgi:anti-sigma factor RsiW
MECLHNNKQGAEILTEHLAGTMDPARQSELERHTKDCPDCRRLLEVWDRLDDFHAPALSEDFDHRLYARIANEGRMPWWRRMWLPTASLWRPLWRPVLPVAAACAVLVLALLVRNPDSDVSVKDDSVKQVRIEQNGSPEIEQVVQALDDLELLSPVNSGPAGAI